jgi:H+/Na+-translocating ferredoxin:NAD+ oxidoreductase subunit G
MNTIVRMIVVLTAISLISGGLLSTLDSYTAPRIAENRMKQLKGAISEVLPKYDYYDELKIGQSVIYIGRLEGVEEPVGFAFKAAGNGFQGNITMMVGVKADFSEIINMRVLEQVETPGLGTKIVEDPSRKEDIYWFPKQFRGLILDPAIEVLKNQKAEKDNEIEAISGATITSKAVARILNEQINEYKRAYEAR